MRYDLFEYQEDVAEPSFQQISSALNDPSGQNFVVIKAPTGSGKTVLCAGILSKLAGARNDDWCAIWLSPGTGGLHDQSRRSLSTILEDEPISVVEITPDFLQSNDSLDPNMVAVVNWEAIRARDEDQNYTNRITRDGENSNVWNLLERTRLNDIEVLVIIDETHIGNPVFTGDQDSMTRSALVLADIQPSAKLMISATPPSSLELQNAEIWRADQINIRQYYHNISYETVSDFGSIKRETIINRDIQISIDEIEAENIEVEGRPLILRAGRECRDSLSELYRAAGSAVNPLALVQIPNADEEIFEEVVNWFAENDITEENGRLAIWLDGHTSTNFDREEIRENTSPIQYLIFKQAIAVGWDCPRSHVLIRFREVGSRNFNIQTVGRVLRMPEPVNGHYPPEFDELNVAYIFGNVQTLGIPEHVDANGPPTCFWQMSRRNDMYLPIGLRSTYLSRIDYADVTAAFSPIFSDVAQQEEFGNCIEDVDRPMQGLLADIRIEDYNLFNIDRELELDAEIQMSEVEVQRYWEAIIQENMSPFRSRARSVPRIKNAIYSWFENLDIGWRRRRLEIQNICINNHEIFIRILTQSIDLFRQARLDVLSDRAVREAAVTDPYELPEEYNVSSQTHELHMGYPHYIMQPCYLQSGRSGPERSFDDYLHQLCNQGIVSWWWKNGDNAQPYFGIEYTKPDGLPGNFYPDYIVSLTDGSLGIIETKSQGDEDPKTPHKSESLQEYLTEMNNDGERPRAGNYFGGIAMQQGGHWYYFDSEGGLSFEEFSANPNQGCSCRDNWFTL